MNLGILFLVQLRLTFRRFRPSTRFTVLAGRSLPLRLNRGSSSDKMTPESASRPRSAPLPQRAGGAAAIKKVRIQGYAVGRKHCQGVGAIG